MKKPHLLYALLLALLLPLGHAQAQTFNFQIGGGLSTHYGSSSQAVGAYKIGVGYEWELGQHWAFSPSLQFYGKGWKDPNEQVYVFDDDHKQLFDEETGEPLTGTMNRSATKNYLELPLLITYYLRTGESRYWVFRAGPYLAYGVGGKQKTKGDAQQTGVNRYYYEQKTFNEPGTHRFDFGLQTFVGYQFPSSFTLGLEADWGLIKWNTAGKRNLSALISLGYKL